MSQTVEEIAQNVGTAGEGFEKSVEEAVAVLVQINDALKVYRSQLKPQLRTVVDAITAMQGTAQ